MNGGYEAIRSAMNRAENEGDLLWVTKLISSPELGISYITAHKYVNWMKDLGIIYTIDRRTIAKDRSFPINTHDLLFMEVFYQMNDEERRRMVTALEHQASALERIAEAMESNCRKPKVETKVKVPVESK